jgi:hypothetical protein
VQRLQAGERTCSGLAYIPPATFLRMVPRSIGLATCGAGGVRAQLGREVEAYHGQSDVVSMHARAVRCNES